MRQWNFGSAPLPPIRATRDRPIPLGRLRVHPPIRRSYWRDAAAAVQNMLQPSQSTIPCPPALGGLVCLSARSAGPLAPTDRDPREGTWQFSWCPAFRRATARSTRLRSSKVCRVGARTREPSLSRDDLDASGPPRDIPRRRRIRQRPALRAARPPASSAGAPQASSRNRSGSNLHS